MAKQDFAKILADAAGQGKIYLDFAATSPLLPCVKERMSEVLEQLTTGELGNASALHSPGHLAHEIIETARASVARIINAEPDEIIFTSGGSEANNTVTNIFAGQPQAVSAIEHPSLLESAKQRASSLMVLPVDRKGRVVLPRTSRADSNLAPGCSNTHSDAQSADFSNARLVSVMLANNELGTIQPVSELAELFPAARIHSDATQAFGKIKIDVKALNVGYLTISAHKIGGPVGIGALYVKKGAPYRPLIVGGHQEQRRRAGTSNPLLAAGFGAAADWAWEHWSCRAYLKVANLRNLLAMRILREVPYSSINGFEQCVYDKASNSYNTLPNILNVSFQAAEGESIQLYLDAAGVAVSTGSACAAGDIKPSHVLMATTGDAEVAHSSIRFSLDLDTTAEDIDRVMQVLPVIVKHLQNISTVKIAGVQK